MLWDREEAKEKRSTEKEAGSVGGGAILSLAASAESREMRLLAPPDARVWSPRRRLWSCRAEKELSTEPCRTGSVIYKETVNKPKETL